MNVFLFPGQGSQFAGMAKDLYQESEKAKHLLDSTSDILGYDLLKIMFEGDENELKQTRITQPAIFVHSIARLQSVDDIQAQAVAGHSLGEFSALVAAGALSFEEGLQLVSARGEAMQKAGDKHAGSMAAIIGLDDDLVRDLCHEASKIDMVVPANFNATGQVVVSGTENGVDALVNLAKDAGCRMAKKLPVSGAFHSPLMADALIDLKAALDKVVFKDAQIPVYANVNAKAWIKAEDLRNNVIEQLQNPVLWTQTLNRLQVDGFTDFVEVGPGKVLQGLTKRTLKGVTIKGYQ